MTNEEIEAIAQRPTYCKTDGEAVTLSRAERDALVAMAKKAARYETILDEVDQYLQCILDRSMSRNNGISLAEELQRQIDTAMAKEQA